MQENKIKQNLLKEIFASVLDVSFAHTGGIIALVDINPLLKGEPNEAVLHPCDYLLEEKDYNSLVKCFKGQPIDNREVKRRILKRKVISALIKDKTFTEIDRKLRGELISLDGACILDNNGKVCACGAIIKNDSGSTGGGRGAASKKLSQYGFAIKISTDGYIELYINGVKKYSIK